jgi:hypothetical protein
MCTPGLVPSLDAVFDQPPPGNGTGYGALFSPDGSHVATVAWRVQSPDGESLPLGPEREGSRRAGLVQSLFDPPTSGQAP